MDNAKLDVVSEGDGIIAHVLRATWHSYRKATHYVVANLKEMPATYYVRPSVTPADGTRENVRVNGVPMIAWHSEGGLAKVGVGGVPTLILLDGEERDALPLPFPLDRDQAADFIEKWLRSTDYGKEPDHDGSNGRGWRLFVEDWGHVAGYRRAIVAAQPAWALYGK